MKELKCVEYKSHGALTDFINTHGISEDDNSRYYLDLLQEAEDRRNADIEKFFNMIIENKYKWCD